MNFNHEEAKVVKKFEEQSSRNSERSVTLYHCPVESSGDNSL